MVFRTWLENQSWSPTRINQFNSRPLAQNAPQSVVAFKLSASRETTISKSSTHKSFNVDPLYMAQQIVRFSYKERICNSLNSSLFFETHCLFWKTTRNHHCIVLKQLLFDRGKQWEKRGEWEWKREKTLKPFKCKERLYRVLELMAPKRFKRPFTSIQVPSLCLLDDIGKHYGITVVRSWTQ